MDTRSLLSSEHIVIKAVAGRTEAFIAVVQAYLTTLFGLSDEFGSAEIVIRLDDEEHRFRWLDDERPGQSEGTIRALADAASIDVRIDLCWDLFRMVPEQQALRGMLAGGGLKDLVKYQALMSDEHTASLVMSGLYHGAFLHGSVPFSGQTADILATTSWNGLTHRAQFMVPEVAEVRARELADQLEQRFEIELSFDDEGRELLIEGLELKGSGDVHFYRDVLEKLLQLSARALITGSLTPEDDDTYALLRFVQEGSQVIIQTAVAD